MTAVVPDSKALRSALEALPVEKKREIKAKRHPHLGWPRMLILASSTWAGDQVVRELEERFGRCRWFAGRWRIQRPQLKLPGF